MGYAGAGQVFGRFGEHACPCLASPAIFEVPGGQLEAMLKPSWGHLGPLLATLQPSWIILGSSWSYLSSWGDLGQNWCNF